MGIGLGVVLLVLGLIFTFALQVDIPGLGDQALGWILILGGIVSIVLGLVMNKQRRESRHIEERRYDGPAR